MTAVTDALSSGRTVTMVRSSSPTILTLTLAGAIALTLAPAGVASAATTIDGPIGLGTAAPFSVLGASTVTNTGPSVLNGDVGLSPGSSITGIPPAVVSGTVHATDSVAAQGQIDLTTAYGVAASLTPTTTGLGDLAGQSLTPGVYSGGELSLSGALTLAGTAESVWVFQAASTLTIGSGAIITVTGGASACNVFWQVGSSATLNPGAQFVGTVMANESITAQTGATITGRLLARTGAVTLDTNTIIAPTGCTASPGTISISPEITSAAPPAGAAGVDYSHTVSASGTPTPTYEVTGGSLPPGLTLDVTSGEISGTPTTPGTYPFTITARNGTNPDATVDYSVTIDAASPPEEEVAGGGDSSAGRDSLAEGGVNVAPGLTVGLGALLFGVALHLYARAARRRREA